MRSNAELNGPSSRALRVVCLAVSVVAVGLFVLGLPLYYRQLQVPCLAAHCYVSPTLAQVEQLQGAGFSLAVFAAYQVIVVASTALVNILVAAVIFLRRPADPMAWITGLVLVTFGTVGIHDSLLVQELLAPVSPLWRWLLVALVGFGGCSVIVFFFIFPNGVFVPRRLRWPILALLVWQILVALFPGAWFDTATWPIGFRLVYWILFFSVLLGAQWYRYRFVSTPLQRQQTKWALLGFSVSFGGALAAFPITELPVDGPVQGVFALIRPTSYFWFLSFIPLFIGLAILRSRLWEIDVIIRRTLLYSALTALLALVYFGSVILMQALVRGLTGGESPLVIVLSTLLIAALFVPLRSRVQRGIDRRFYRRKYDTARTLAAFGAQARDVTDLPVLTTRLQAAVQDTMQPAYVGLWLRGIQSK